MNRQWQTTKWVFQQAIEMPADEREEFVCSVCEDVSQREQILHMLAVHFDDADFLTSPFATEPALDSIDPLIGKIIGQFVVEKRIGSGGMGSVYEASQKNPHRIVAIKVLRLDNLHSPSALKRFQNESEILGKLKHPNIAHVYESGSVEHADGIQPWFAMERIDGCTLNEYLRESNPTIDSTLQLFITICEAVSFAHRKGIIHRDLKPANILIQNDSAASQQGDSLPVPKIVDFGIARFAGKKFATMTATQGVMGTLDYLSPEQINQDRVSIDHRSDIYSLGVVAFEMLTGQLPFDRKSGSLTNIVSRININERTRLRSISRDVSPELELIIGKALETEKSQRYQSVDELIDDLQRHRQHLPILARPPSILYRTSKYIRRNKILVAGATTTCLALLAGLITYAVIAERAKSSAAEARYEADKAVAVNSFLTNDFLTRLLNNIQSSQTVESIPVVDLIELSSSRIDTIVNDQPLIEAAVRNEIGTLFYNVGGHDKAAEQYQLALDLWESGLGQLHPDTLKAVNNLALARMAMGLRSAPETETLCRRAYQGRLQVLGVDSNETMASLNNLAEVLRSRNRIDDAELLYRRGIEIARELSGEGQRTRLIMAANLGSICLARNDITEARLLHKEAFETALSVYGLSHPTTLQAGIRYVQTLDRARMYSEAETTMLPIVEQYERVAESDSNAILIPYRLLARIYRHQDRDKEAKETLKLALAAAEKDAEKNARVIEKISRDLKHLKD